MSYQLTVALDMAKIDMGCEKKETKKQEERNERIETLVQGYLDNHNKKRLLRGIAYNYMI